MEKNKGLTGKIEELLQEVIAGNQKSVQEIADLLKSVGLLNQEIIGFLNGIAMTGNELLIKHFMLYLAPKLQEIEPMLGIFKQPDPGLVDGSIRFAKTELGHWVGLNDNEAHVLICGQSNTGKSWLIFLILLQAIGE